MFLTSTGTARKIVGGSNSWSIARFCPEPVSQRDQARAKSKQNPSSPGKDRGRGTFGIQGKERDRQELPAGQGTEPL